MFSLRALTRSAPRIASRTAPRTAFTTPRLLQSTLRPAFSTSIPRTFTSSFTLLDSTGQELAAKLEQERILESEESATPADSDSNISAFLSQNPHWTLTDNAGEQEVLLTRDFDDETITVGFSIADFNTPMMEGDEEADEAMLDEDDESLSAQSGGANTKGSINQGRTSGGNVKVAPEDSIAPADREGMRDAEDEEEGGAGQPAFPATVNVLIQRPAKGALRINLIADNGVFTIQSVTHLPDSKSTSNKSASDLLHETPETLYTGPPFQQLDEEVQSLLEQYLDVRGINTALALFVPEYIDVKEQREYLGWLGRVKEFVEN